MSDAEAVEFSQDEQVHECIIVRGDSPNPRRTLRPRRSQGRPLGSRNRRDGDSDDEYIPNGRDDFSDGENSSDGEDSLDQGDRSDQEDTSDDDGPSDQATSSRQLVTKQAQAPGVWDPSSEHEKLVFAELRTAYHNGVNLLKQRHEKRASAAQETVEARERFNSANPDEPPGVYNQDQEEELSLAWEKSLIKGAIEQASNGGSDTLSVWELSLRLFDTDPLSLLSMYYDMEFDDSADETTQHQGPKNQNRLWTPLFCKKLKRIMTHPFFNDANAYRFIPIAIRWAAMCRKPSHQYFSDEELRVLKHFHCGDLGPSWSPLSILARFHSHQAQLEAERLSMTPHAKLLTRIAAYTGAPEVAPSSNNTPVKSDDLGVVISALENMNDNGMNVSCETHFLVYSTSHPSRGNPTGLPELLDAYKRSWKDERLDRHVRRRDNNVYPSQNTNYEDLRSLERESRYAHGEGQRPFSDLRDDAQPNDLREPPIERPRDAPARDSGNAIEVGGIKVEPTDQVSFNGHGKDAGFQGGRGGYNPRRGGGHPSKRGPTLPRDQGRQFPPYKKRKTRSQRRGGYHPWASERGGMHRGGMGRGREYEPNPNHERMGFHPPAGPRAWGSQQPRDRW
ncbi:hypothetical protein F53441_4228 [Fusarium austroafricanum]|uniref:Uncharacterized protein n=1 Tax=Fusarium austroafricanum TaxID=2364996 RepID=A0A8H4KMH5_9HYPO|nr:hypothetical protein F53441_4228 [Fusarium austroafricanum]